MKLYLLHIGAWTILNGTFPRPDEPTTAEITAAMYTKAEYRKDIREWQKLNDAGLGAIRLKVSDSVR